MAESSGPDATAPAGLQISNDDQPEATVLKLSGELDIASARMLERAIESLGSSDRRLVLDLGELAFMDSSGLRALLHARQQAAATNRELLLRHGPRQVQRVFELSGTLDTFTFED